LLFRSCRVLRVFFWWLLLISIYGFVDGIRLLLLFIRGFVDAFREP
jgi:hypothetical protein